MKVWLACVVLLFGAAELYHWLQGVTLSLPVCGVAGLLLAVTSNSRFWLRAKPAPSLTAPATDDLSQSESPFPSAVARPSAQLPNLTPPTAPSISFEIARKK